MSSASCPNQAADAVAAKQASKCAPRSRPGGVREKRRAASSRDGGKSEDRLTLGVPVAELVELSNARCILC